MKHESPIRDLLTKLRAVAQDHIAYPQVAYFMDHMSNHMSALAYAEENNRLDSRVEDLEKIVRHLCPDKSADV